MSKAIRLFRPCVRPVLLITALTVLSACVSVPAEFRSSRLALQKGTLSGFKYTFDGSRPEGVYNFFGLYNGSYLDLLSQQPLALEEAKRAVPYQYASLGITAVTTFLAFSAIADAGSSDTGTISGASEASDHLTRATGYIMGGLLANILLGIPTRDHLFGSAGLFNAGLTSPDSDPIDHGLARKMLFVLPSTVWLNPTTGQIDMGWRLRR